MLQLLLEDRCFPLLLAGLVGIIVGGVFRVEAAVAYGAVLFFSAFDAIGFQKLLKRREKPNAAIDYDTLLPFYRVIQTGVQIILTVVAYYVSLKAAAIFWLCWWFGICDLLYYVCLKQNYMVYGPMPWLWWSVPGILFGKTKTTGVILNIFSAIGFAGSVVWLVI